MMALSHLVIRLGLTSYARCSLRTLLHPLTYLLFLTAWLAPVQTQNIRLILECGMWAKILHCRELLDPLEYGCAIILGCIHIEDSLMKSADAAFLAQLHQVVVAQSQQGYQLVSKPLPSVPVATPRTPQCDQHQPQAYR